MGSEIKCVRSYQEALDALEEFQNKVVTLGAKAFKIEKINVSKYKISFVYENIVVEYVLSNTYLCKKKVERIIKNINAPLRTGDEK